MIAERRDQLDDVADLVDQDEPSSADLLTAARRLLELVDADGNPALDRALDAAHRELLRAERLLSGGDAS